MHILPATEPIPQTMGEEQAMLSNHNCRSIGCLAYYWERVLIYKNMLIRHKYGLHTDKDGLPNNWELWTVEEASSMSIGIH